MRGLSRALAVSLLLLAACGDGGAVDEGSGSRETAPGSRLGVGLPAEAPPVDTPTPVPPSELAGEVISLSIDGVRYWLGRDPEGCVVLTMEIGGVFYSTDRRQCGSGSGQWDDVVDCAYRPPFERPPGTTPPGVYADYAYPECEVPVPAVTIGMYQPGPDLLCLAEHEEDRFGPVQFVELTGERTYLLAGRYAVPFPYTADGRRYGEPPLDGPAASIYALCDAAGPWTGSPPPEAFVEVVVHLHGDVVDRSGGLSFDYGRGHEWIEFTDRVMILAFTPYVDATEIEIGVFSGDAVDDPRPVGTYRLPAGLIADLSSGWQCFDPYYLVIEVGPAVTDGDPSAVSLAYVSPDEVEAIIGGAAAVYGIGGEVTRVPGEPCPGAGRQLTAPERPGNDYDTVMEMLIEVDVDGSWSELGEEWALWVIVEEPGNSSSGLALDFSHVPGDSEDLPGVWGFFSPGLRVLVGIDRPESEPDLSDPRWVVLRIPEPPGDLDAFELDDARLILSVGSGDIEGPELDPDTITLGWLTPGAR